MYFRCMLLKDSDLIMQDVVETINYSDEGISILVDNSGIITSTNRCKDVEM